MFDVGFSELIMVAVVALLVVGPERLPKLARVAGMWLGRARRTLVSVKQEIDRELKAGELAEILKQQAVSKPLETILEEASKPPSPSSTPAAPASADPSATPDQHSRG
ncbi:Sec-independent protein translocase protein TatB [uncultured Thiocystis sp.]|jgi:sec-independent protein translocase protein TatB|uniref:Sec-independent protein translocase protein TatB n=1 Tax=uncultured Thiocystis sp. TaxID=1202134 RepID=UPI0025CC9575|nr:Sec-independent protein translocase protein TatB [uncultured Thiocystis sp.]